MADDMSMQMKIAITLICTAGLVAVVVNTFIMMNRVMINYASKYDTAINSTAGSLVDLTKESSGIDGAIVYTEIMNSVGSIETVYLYAESSYLGSINDIRTEEMKSEYPYDTSVTKMVNGKNRGYKVFTLYNYKAKGEALDAIYTKFATSKFRLEVEKGKSSLYIVTLYEVGG